MSPFAVKERDSVSTAVGGVRLTPLFVAAKERESLSTAVGGVILLPSPLISPPFFVWPHMDKFVAVKNSKSARPLAV